MSRSSVLRPDYPTNAVKLRYHLFLILVLSLTSNFVKAQSAGKISSMGQDFYLSYLEPSIKCAATKPFMGVYALISSPYDCDVAISYFDSKTGSEIAGVNKRIAAKYFWQAPLDLSQMVSSHRDGEVPEFTACHIHSDFPVSVQYYSTGPNAGGLALVLPVATLGKEYVISSLPTNLGHGAAISHHFACDVDSGSSVFTVIAVVNNTNVTITPNGTTRAGHVGLSTGANANGIDPHPYTVKLSRGQVYTVKSKLDDFASDLSGSIVSSDKAIAVFAGHESAYNGETRIVNNGGDQRNMLVQQMVPVEFWRKGDYYSMPFYDSPTPAAGDASSGDEYKVYTHDQNSVTSTIGTQSPRTDALAPYHMLDYPNVMTGVTFTASERMMVSQYDYRQMNDADPFPSPMMMNVVPGANYARSFIFGVPDDKNQVHKKRYINIIGRKNQVDKIQLWKDAVGPKILTTLPQPGGNSDIPNHPELIGKRFEITPGCYFLKADSAFMVYAYGMFGLDPDFDLGDNDDDDYYFSYAAPAGETFGLDTQSIAPKTSITTLCNSWKVLVSSMGGAPLASAEILNDPLGLMLRRPGSDAGYVSRNVSRSNQPALVSGDTSYTFEAYVADPYHDAEAYVWVVNRAGADTLLHLTYTAPSLSIIPTAITLAGRTLGEDTCMTIVLKNNMPSGSLPIHYDLISLRHKSGFRIKGFNHLLPINLQPGDSLVITLCYYGDTSRVSLDTMMILGDCYTTLIPLAGLNTYPKIKATDGDFGLVLLNTTACRSVTVANTGTAPLVLTKDWVLGMGGFSFIDSNLLPLTIPVGQQTTLVLCFTPQYPGLDSTNLIWGTNIPSPFSHLDKDYSILRGEGLLANLRWSIARLSMGTLSHTTRRVWLVNDGQASVTVDSVIILGADQSDFKIADDQLGDVYPTPIGNFVLTPGDSIYVDLTFEPDTLQMQARQAQLVAYDRLNITPRLNMLGMIGLDDVATKESTSRVQLVPNPALEKVTVMLPDALSSGCTISISDILGNEIIRLKGTGSSRSIDVSGLAPGSYYLRAANERVVTTAPLRIVR